MTGTPPGPVGCTGQADGPPGPPHELLTSLATKTKAVIATIVTSTAITQPRTVRNLVHSACTRCQKLSRSGVSGERRGVDGLRRHDVASARYSTLWLVSSM